jgi:hypothetical protein
MSTLIRMGAGSTLLRDGLALALMLLLAVAIPAIASADEPFKSTFHEQFAATACPAGTAPAMLCASVQGTGEASHLGRVSETADAVVNLAAASPTTGCAPVVATATLTAADGDTLLLRTTGTFCRGAGDRGTDAGTYEVIGGSGRFAHASGHGRYLTRAVFGQGFSGTSVTTMEGSLELR